MASAASSARIRDSTSAISASVRAPSSRVARSSSSSSKTSASSSGSACTCPRISVSSSLDASSIRSAICAGFSRRTRPNGPRVTALPAWPISGSNLDQSRNTCPSGSPASRPGPRRRQGRRRGLRRVSTPSSTHCPSRNSSSRSAARTRCAVSTSISLCPSTSARSSTSPSRRSNRRRSIRALVSLITSPSSEATCPAGTNTSLPPTAATRPVTAGRSAPLSRTMTSVSRPTGSPPESVIGRRSSSDKCSVRAPRAAGTWAAGGVVIKGPLCSSQTKWFPPDYHVTADIRPGHCGSVR